MRSASSSARCHGKDSVRPRASTGRMRLEPARPQEDMHPFAAERLYAPAERDPVRERRVHERQHDNGGAHPGHLGEDAESVGIAGALRPLVHRVVRRWGDDDGVRDPRPQHALLAVLAADRISCELLDGGLIEELQGTGCRDDLNGPAFAKGQLDQSADCRGRPRAADDDRQDPAGYVTGQRDTPASCIGFTNWPADRR
jgi:hypothetical protein